MRVCYWTGLVLPFVLHTDIKKLIFGSRHSVKPYEFPNVSKPMRVGILFIKIQAISDKNTLP